MHTSPDPAARGARGLFVLLMTFAWLGGPRAMAAPSQPPAAAAPVDATKQQLAEVLRRSFRMAEQADRQIPRDGFDPQGVIERVGLSSEKLFEWVRDQTYWVPYTGALRGPRGVLMDRLGNSLDRSLLLCELLRSAGGNVRLAHAKLDANLASELLAKVRPVPAEPMPVNQNDSDPAALDRLAAAAGLDPALIRPSREKVRMLSEQAAERTIQRATEQADALAALVGGPPAQSGGQPDRADPAAALADHWWVQLERDGNWTDLDPLLPDAAPGKKLADAIETPAPKDLPNELWHTIGVRFVVEKLQGGQLQEQTALDHTFRPADLIGSKIMLGNRPTHWPATLDLSDEKTGPKRLQDAVLAQHEWLPVMLIDGREISDSLFTDTGEVRKADSDDQAGQVGRVAQQNFGGFGGALAGGGGGTPQNASQLTAEWIEYRITRPGAAGPLVVRRDVFDLIGPAARAAGKLPAGKFTDAQRLDRGLATMDAIELLPQVCHFPSSYIDHLMLQGCLAVSDQYLYLMTGTGPVADPKNVEARQPKPTPSKLYNLAAARRTWSPAREGLYFDRPNLLAHRIRVRADVKGNFTYGESFDIIANQLQALPPMAGQSVSLRLRQGVLETCAEASLLAAPFGPMHNTSEMMARSAAQQIRWVPMRSAEDPKWASVQIPADVRARATQDLAAGYVVVVPERGVNVDGETELGWWRINPATGETLGRMDTGEGQSLTERIIQHSIMGLISFSPTALKWYCDKQGRSDGMCSPCLIAALSILAAFIGFADGLVAFNLGDKSAAVFFIWDVGNGGVGMGKSAGPCVESAMHPQM
jgi:hypothetical protein